VGLAVVRTCLGTGRRNSEEGYTTVVLTARERKKFGFICRVPNNSLRLGKSESLYAPIWSANLSFSSR
jgi:hypothetical protein